MNAKFLAGILSTIVLSTPIYAASAPSGTAKPQSAPQQSVSTAINLNTADVATLTHSFKGIGKKRAEAIVKYRDEHQGFKTIEELGDVPGIGQTFVNRQLPELKNQFSIG